LAIQLIVLIAEKKGWYRLQGCK